MMRKLLSLLYTITRYWCAHGNCADDKRVGREERVSLYIYIIYCVCAYLNISRRHIYIYYYYILFSFWRHLVSMRAFANLNDRTLKLICGEKKKIPTSSFVFYSFSLTSSPSRWHIPILYTLRQPLHKRSPSNPYYIFLTLDAILSRSTYTYTSAATVAVH